MGSSHVFPWYSFVSPVLEYCNGLSMQPQQKDVKPKGFDWDSYIIDLLVSVFNIFQELLRSQGRRTS